MKIPVVLSKAFNAVKDAVPNLRGPRDRPNVSARLNGGSFGWQRQHASSSFANSTAPPVFSEAAQTNTSWRGKFKALFRPSGTPGRNGSAPTETPSSAGSQARLNPFAIAQLAEQGRVGDLDDEQLSFVEHDSYLPNLFGNARGASVSDLADPMQEAYLRDSGWASFSGSPDQDLDGFPETVTVPKGYMSEIEDSDGSETLTEASLRRLDREYSGVWQAVRDQNEWLHQRLAVDLSSVSEADLGALSDLGSTDSDSFSNADFGQREAPALAPASFKVDEPTASRSSPFTHTVARQGVGAASSSSRSWTFADPAPDRGFGLALGGSSPFGEAARNVLGRGEFSWATGGRFAPTGEVTNIPFGNDLERPERPRNSGSDPVDRELDDWLPAAAKSLQEEDDFALAQRLQQEEDDSALAQRLQQEEDDSALAQRLQQEEDDSALAQRLQQQEVNFAARGAGHRR